MPRRFSLGAKEKSELKAELYSKYGHYCHYCGIPEDEFQVIWAGPFYGDFKRGNSLEIDRVHPALGYEKDNCVLDCALCNMCKSDKFSYDEFQKMGKVIREIWELRKKHESS